MVDKEEEMAYTLGGLACSIEWTRADRLNATVPNQLTYSTRDFSSFIFTPWSLSVAV